MLLFFWLGWDLGSALKVGVVPQRLVSFATWAKSMEIVKGTEWEKIGRTFFHWGKIKYWLVGKMLHWEKGWQLLTVNTNIQHRASVLHFCSLICLLKKRIWSCLTTLLRKLKLMGCHSSEWKGKWRLILHIPNISELSAWLPAYTTPERNHLWLESVDL